MSKRVEDIRRSRATLTSGLEQRDLSRQVEVEAGMLEFSTDEKNAVWQTLREYWGSRWPTDTHERNAILYTELRRLSGVVAGLPDYGAREWHRADSEDRISLLKTLLMKEYGKPEAPPQPKPKEQWMRENQDFLQGSSPEESDRAYRLYVKRVETGRIEP